MCVLNDLNYVAHFRQNSIRPNDMRFHVNDFPVNGGEIIQNFQDGTWCVLSHEKPFSAVRSKKTWNEPRKPAVCIKLMDVLCKIMPTSNESHGWLWVLISCKLMKSDWNRLGKWIDKSRSVSLNILIIYFQYGTSIVFKCNNWAWRSGFL